MNFIAYGKTRLLFAIILNFLLLNNPLRIHISASHNFIVPYETLFCFTHKGTFMIKSLNLPYNTPNFALGRRPSVRLKRRVRPTCIQRPGSNSGSPVYILKRTYKSRRLIAQVVLRGRIRLVSRDRNRVGFLS
jgi:hypothetical protein